MPTCILVNAHAGSASTAEALQEVLSSRPDVAVREPTSREETAELTAWALEHGYDTIVAAGGDGTINTVVNALAPDFDRARIGIIPLGTGNDLCRTLSIPTDPLQALALVLEGVEGRLDVMRAETSTRATYCVNVATGGFTGQLEEQITEEIKAWWGPLAYVRSAATVLPNLTEYVTTLRLDGGPAEQVPVLNLLVANGRTAGGGLLVAPRANPEDGLLDVVVVRYAPLIDLTGVAARLLTGDYLNSDQVLHQTARRVQVASKPGMWFSIDGELWSNEPITFTVHPRALRVLIGPDYRPTPNT